MICVRSASFKPIPDAWSVAGIVEHLAIVQDRVIGRIDQLLLSTADPAPNGAKFTDEILTEKVADRSAKFPAPEGGLFSTAGDMARFHQMLLDKGTLNGQRILSAAGVEEMTSSHTGTMKAGFAPGVGHGFGFEVVRETLGTFRYNSIGSFVKGGAYRTYAWVDPAKDMVGIILMQRTNGGGDVADEINSFMAMAAAAIEDSSSR